MTEMLSRTTSADNRWLACGQCRCLLYGKRYAREALVCPECGWHAPMTAEQRIDLLLDQHGRQPLPVSRSVADPLGFVDTQPYPQRMETARQRTGLDEAVVCVRGAIADRPVVLAVMDFRFLGGSLGCAVGERITAAAEVALRERIPLVLVTASGGARMQEGALSLMQMVKTSQALARLDEAGIFTVAVVTDPTYGGVAASFASLTDVIIAEPGARLGFAGPRVIEQTIRRTLPPGFQSAEFLLEHGLIDEVTPRGQLRATLARLLACAHASVRATTPATVSEPSAVGGPPAPPPGSVSDDPWQLVRRARNIDRPTTRDYIGCLIEGFTELHGDRASGDCAAIVGGLGRLDGRPIVIVGHQKGHNSRELVRCNFGMPSPAGYRKAGRLMRLAAKLGLPVVTLIDTPGAYPGPEAEENGQSIAIAENIRLMSRLSVPIVAVITGEGGSGGALALGVANQVLILQSAIYSVISPEGCAAILWKTPAEASTAAAALRLTPPELLELGIVDGVIDEPLGGAHAHQAAAAEALRDAVTAALQRYDGVSPDDLVSARWVRFRRYGAADAA